MKTNIFYAITVLKISELKTQKWNLVIYVSKVEFSKNGSTAQEISKGVSICIIEAFYVVMKIDLNFKGHYLIIDHTDSHRNGTFLS